MAHSEQ